MALMAPVLGVLRTRHRRWNLDRVAGAALGNVLDQDTLERERGFLKTLIRSLPDLVWLKDPEGRYRACNRRFESFFGAPEAAASPPSITRSRSNCCARRESDFGPDPELLPG